MQQTKHQINEELLSDSQFLTHTNDIELRYHYNVFGYLKLFAGGTAIPKSIDILNKEDHSIISTIKDKKLLDEMADD